MMTTRLRSITVAGTIASLLLLSAACDSGTPTGGTSSSSAATAASTGTGSSDAASGAASSVPTSLFDKLPASIQAAGVINTTANLNQKPWAAMDTSSQRQAGVIPSIAPKLEQVLGVKLNIDYVDFTAALPGLNAVKYDVALTARADTASGEQTFDFIDYAKDYITFIVKKGNPTGIQKVDDLCGKTVSYTAGGLTESIVKAKITDCPSKGLPELKTLVLSSPAQGPASLDAGRSDAIIQTSAVARGIVDANPSAYDLALNDPSNFPPVYLGGVAVKGSALTPVLLEALTQLYESGDMKSVFADNQIADLVMKPTLNAQTATG